MVRQTAPSLTRRRVLAGASTVLLGGVGGTASALYSPDDIPQEEPLIIGHRGAAGIAPDNTIASIRRALEYDVDGVALDVRCTADDQLILFHDPILDWASDGHGVVRLTKWDQIKGTTIDGEPIPTLEEALAELTNTDIEIYLEMKRTGYTDTVLDLVEQHGLSDRVTISSFSPTALSPAVDQGVPVALLGATPTDGLVEDAVAHDASVAIPHYTPHAVPRFVEQAHESGIQAGVWHIVETKRSLRDSLGADPDLIVTNRPDYAREILDE